MLREVIQIHGNAILTSFRNQLCHASNIIFSPSGIVELILDGISSICFGFEPSKINVRRQKTSPTSTLVWR